MPASSPAPIPAMKNAIPMAGKAKKEMEGMRVLAPMERMAARIQTPNQRTGARIPSMAEESPNRASGE